MRTNRLLTLLVFVLIILNAVLLSVLFIGNGKKAHPPHPGPDFKEILIQDLGFTRKQADSFRELAQGHHQQMMGINREHNRLIHEYFGSLANGKDNNPGLMEKIKNTEQSKIELTYQHFEDIKGLCTTDQLKDFPVVLNKAVDILLPGAKKRPPPRRK